MWQKKIFYGFGLSVFASLLSLWSGVFRPSASALSPIPNVTYKNAAPDSGGDYYSLTNGSVLSNGNFYSYITFNIPNISDTIYFTFNNLSPNAGCSSSSSLFGSDLFRSASFVSGSSFTTTSNAFPLSAVHLDSDSNIQSCHGYIDTSSVDAPVIQLLPWNYGVTFTSDSTFSFSYSEDCPDCPDCPEIPANPYDDKLDNIYHAILLVGASFVVIMFLYQILRIYVRSWS